MQAAQGQEAERLLALYDAQLEEVCTRTKIKKEFLDRGVQRAYQRWQWADDPKFPRELRKTKFD